MNKHICDLIWRKYSICDALDKHNGKETLTVFRNSSGKSLSPLLEDLKNLLTQILEFHWSL